MERIANPMAGRLGLARRPDPRPTRLMLVCRYTYAFVAPAGLLLWTSLPDDEAGLRALLLCSYLLASWPLSAGANGSWGSAPLAAWHLGMAIEGVALIGAMAWGTLADDPLVIPFVTTLLMGAVLGVGALQLWHSLQRRRP